jgi:hypothetical protein
MLSVQLNAGNGACVNDARYEIAVPPSATPKLGVKMVGDVALKTSGKAGSNSKFCLTIVSAYPILLPVSLPMPRKAQLSNSGSL